ncbi:MAG: N-methyl-L-tryptophan oxidase [Phycisphaerae bacterium]
MPRHYHTIVLGLGAMGSAAAFHLAKRRLAVLGLEQFDIPNDLGSSHGQSRLIRLAYYEHPDYVPLLRRAYELWRNLESEMNQVFLHITGGLYLAASSHELITGSLASAKQHHIPHELLSANAIKRRFPQFQLRKEFVALYERHAGFLQVEKAVLAHANAARRHGADLHTREAALEWSAANGKVSVRTAKDTYTADHLLLTAGPWMGQMMPALARKLTVTRQVMMWFQCKNPQQFQIGEFPSWCMATEAKGLVYGPPILPEDSSPPGLKVAHHYPGQGTSPETVERLALPADAHVVRNILLSRLPDANGPLLAHKVCLYTNSPDQHFIIDQHPDYPNVHFAAGFSGHGFKFASVIGEVLADLSAKGSTEHPIQFLRLERFP